MTIYIDELFIKNCIYSYLILMITGEILNIKYKKKKCLLSSGVSTILTICAIIYDLNEKILIKVIILTLYTYMAYTPKKIEELIVEMTSNISLTFLFGGIFSSSINKMQEIFILGTICVLGIKKYSEYYKKQKWKIRNMYNIELKVEREKIKMKAFLDTGNTLNRFWR